MREILFKGKRVDNGEWAFGNFIEDKWGDDNGNTIYAILQDRVAPDIAELWTPVRVIPETVGQFTGLTDKNGKKIFEGDIVKYNLWDDKFDYCEVKFGYFYAAMDSYNGGPALGFYLADINGKADDIGFYENLYKFVEVIGNIHDNPELLEEKKNE